VALYSDVLPDCTVRKYKAATAAYSAVHTVRCCRRMQSAAACALAALLYAPPTVKAARSEQGVYGVSGPHLYKANLSVMMGCMTHFQVMIMNMCQHTCQHILAAASCLLLLQVLLPAARETSRVSTTVSGLGVTERSGLVPSVGLCPSL
jgi:hypothetical protein